MKKGKKTYGSFYFLYYILEYNEAMVRFQSSLCRKYLLVMRNIKLELNQNGP